MISFSSFGFTDCPVCALCLQLTNHLTSVEENFPNRFSIANISLPPSAPRSGPDTISNPMFSR